ncbi:subtilisin-like protein [Aspergillus violaceofuscus CBS 115571]|uniref:Subtilisin-like protein n=1 Tax=Aspergillus violaceofuscus (strain CBS 115571) TaxID=1450538 RepID=A0A2V5HT73_ASPV1|nr:subtilisin-like protein [Aspergillus violaceofuscus CBS 115571]
MEPIKIAVIDDGIDIGLDIFNNKIGAGDSFLVLDEVYGKRGGAYYVLVKLYVAQLETVDRSDGRRSFTSESATDAINWAVDRDVDIISMSWSINSNRALTHLNDAIGRAEKNQIIMLCSAIDQGSHVRDNTYPGKNKNCIKIGASTVTGERLGWVSKDACDFLLPGENVSLPRRRSSSSSQSGPTAHPQAGPYGSSVSTALAAGLAGALLYCERLLTGPAPEAGTTSSTTSDPVLPYRDQLRGLGQMKVAFGNLAKGGDDKFIQVADHFREEFRSMVWNERDVEDADDTRRRLQQLTATIVNNSTVTSSRLWAV